MASKDRRSERIEKQKVRSKANRDTRKPTADPVTITWPVRYLDIALGRYLRQGRQDDLMRFMDQIARRLEEVGFKRELTEQVWLSLQDSYAAGRRTLLRQRRTIAEREADERGSHGS